jgi:hypothetical protein
VKVTSNAGLLAYRKTDDVFGLTETAACELSDNQTGKNTQYSICKKPYYCAINRKTGGGTEYS